MNKRKSINNKRNKNCVGMSVNKMCVSMIIGPEYE